MLGLLAQLLGQMDQERQLADMYQPPVQPHQGLLEDRPMSPGLGPRAFRDPDQVGPAPPLGRLQRMYSEIPGVMEASAARNGSVIPSAWKNDQAQAERIAMLLRR